METCVIQVEDESSASDLPPELLYNIMSYLPARELFTVSRVCVEWNDVSVMTKWERTIPQWKLDKIPKDFTFNQRQQYLKQYVLEFMTAKRESKLLHENRHPAQIQLKIMKEYQGFVHLSCVRAVFLLLSVMTILLATESNNKQYYMGVI